MVIYWITHKLVENILRQYDGIIVMHKGQIAEYGTFDELMEIKAKTYTIFMLNNYAKKAARRRNREQCSYCNKNEVW